MDVDVDTMKIPSERRRLSMHYRLVDARVETGY
jgi:hypothetical protein